MVPPDYPNFRAMLRFVEKQLPLDYKSDKDRLKTLFIIFLILFPRILNILIHPGLLLIQQV